MFGRKGRGYFYWSRHIIRCELALVAAILLVPILFAPVIPISYDEYAANNPSASYYDYQHNNAANVSVWLWVFGWFHGFVAAFHDDIDALSTAVIAGFTVVLAYSTLKLWRETERLAKGADDQSEKMVLSIAATEKMAAAAQKSAEIAERALMGVERPYMFVRGKFNIIKINLEKRIEFSCTNHGKQPGVVTAVWAKMFKAGGPPKQPYSLGNATNWPIHLPLGNNEESPELSYDVVADFPGDALPVETRNMGNVPDFLGPVIPENERLFFVVQIHYQAPSGAKHLTINSWELKREKGIFVRIDDPDCHMMT